MTRPTTIAIDGPVASGKSVVGRLLAKRLGYRFLDTGSMYRALTWLALERGIDPKDQGSLARLAKESVLQVGEDGVSVIINGRTAPLESRRVEIDQTVSLVARVPQVRRVLVKRQRSIGKEGQIVMVGRDIGSVVLPDAPLKVFLSASTAERARRRHQELLCRGHRVEYNQVLEELEARDRLDSERALSPLKPARDAYQLNTDGMSVDQVVGRILELIKEP